MEEEQRVEKYTLIQDVFSRKNNTLTITWMCEQCQVSRSAYYAWDNNGEKLAKREELDQADFELILEEYNYKGYEKGSRSIHMRLLHQGIRMNRKKIQRLMRKYNLECPIRKANPYRRGAAQKEHYIAPNLVNREFEKHGASKVLLTDITYLKLLTGEFVYLSTVKDAFTKQILAYKLSDSLTVDFVLDTMKELKKKHGNRLQEGCMIHSNQGTHYTSHSFRELFADKKDEVGNIIEKNKWVQSMSRRGNFWDNAPQESFFGHMKDDIDTSSCRSIEQVEIIINDYMDYYNNERYQWKLAKLAPNQYAEFLLTGIHPLENVA